MPIDLSSFAIDIGTTPGDNTGTPGRDCFDLINQMRQEIEDYINKVEVRSFIVPCMAETAEAAVAADVMQFRVPYAFTLTDVQASCKEGAGPTGADLILDILEGTVSLLDSNQLVIPDGADWSEGSGGSSVLADTTLAAGAVIHIDVIQVGSTTPGTGVKVTLIGYIT